MIHGPSKLTRFHAFSGGGAADGSAGAKILLHDLGHAGVAAALNLPSKRIVLSFMGGHVEFVHPPRRRWHDIAVSAAGPMANLATAGALFVIPPFSAPDAAGAGLAVAYLQSLMMISLLLGVFKDRIEREIVSNLDALLEQEEPLSAFEHGLAAHEAGHDPKSAKAARASKTAAKPAGRKTAAKGR